MKRTEFLKGVGLAGLGLSLPSSSALVACNQPGEPAAGDCILIPTETAGPFPLDLSANTLYFRQDVRESKTGVRLNLKLKVIGASNCAPLQNVRVNIWHCDKDGLYSGYDQQNNSGQSGLTYLRGYQMTDANGEVAFVTIFPGWYTGRICHIHFQVYVSSSYAAISQLTFDISTKNAIYASNSSLYTKGADPTTLASDNIFSDGYQYQTATLTPNSTTVGYDSFLEVVVQGSGTTSIGNMEKVAAQHMLLAQNYPNPFNGETIIPFTLMSPSNVRLDLWDIMGRKVATLRNASLPAGEHRVHVDLQALGLPSANYAYQLEMENGSGLFKDCKMMTLLR